MTVLTRRLTGSERSQWREGLVPQGACLCSGSLHCLRDGLYASRRSLADNPMKGRALLRSSRTVLFVEGGCVRDTQHSYAAESRELLLPASQTVVSTIDFLWRLTIASSAPRSQAGV